MDGIVILLLSFVWFCINWPRKEQAVLVEVETNPRLNPEMIHDECAFMKIANELGFH